MNATVRQSRLTLHAGTAGDLMKSNPVSIHESASVHEALVLFTKKGFSAAPVIDNAGRPVGVVSLSDIVTHDRTKLEWGADTAQASRKETTRINELMTPAVFSVSPGTSAGKVIEEMLALKVHRLFVVDAEGVLVGVISALDVLRHLRD